MMQKSDLYDPSAFGPGDLNPSGLGGVLETALYTDDLPEAERFYGQKLQLPKIFEVAGRQLVFRCGSSIVLIFDPSRTEKERIVINGGAIPLHGARGAGHIAFRVAETDLAFWRSRFAAAGVAIESEVNWPNGGRSLYFRDPAGNSLELATPKIWEGLAEAHAHPVAPLPLGG